jgi:putative inorganic carbon (HCO3(-)) transporter
MSARPLAGSGLAAAGAALAAAIAYASATAPVAALAGAAVLALLGCVVLAPELLLVALVAAFPWDDALAYPTATVSVIKILGAIVFVGYLFRSLSRAEDVRVPATLLAAVVFAILVLVSLLLSADPGAGVPQALRYLLFVGFLFVFVQLVRTRSALLWCVRALGLSATIASVLALAAFLGGETGRVAGPIGEANDFAYLLAVVLPLLAYLLATERARRPLWGACLVVVASGLLGTLSRGALVGLAALAVWGLVTRRVPVKGLLQGVLLLAGVLALALTLWGPLIDERLAMKERVADANVASRQALWSAAVHMSADHPLVGVGPGQFGPRSADYLVDDPLGITTPVAHNSFLEVLAENGVLALLAFVAMVGTTWRVLTQVQRRAARGDPDAARLATAAQASLVVAIVSANFLSVQLTVALWLLAGIAVALAAQTAQSGRR